DGWPSKLKFSPLPVISGLVVIFMVLSFAKGGYEQRDSWSWMKSNARAMAGNECALANDVLVEQDPNTGLLSPAPVDGRAAPNTSSALAGAGNGSPDPDGFTPNGVPNRLSIDSTEEQDTATSTAQNTAQSGAGSDASTQTTESAQGGTEGGQGARGVNGSTVRLPFGLDPAKTPVLGSYGSASGTGSLTTDWYSLPARNANAPLLTIAAAGSVQAVDGLGVQH
ncbi:arabinosyltransferase, partial [Streptomyces sp. SID10244]|nr:arabinosyltransferase [Streptomyces sp. SID10244]